MNPNRLDEHEDAACHGHLAAVGVAFLLGMATQAEADAAIDVARTTAGVRKVVNLIEIITVNKAKEIDTAPANGKPDDAPKP